MSYRKKAMKYGAALSAFSLTSLAYAMPDATTITTEVGKAEAPMDAAGVAIMGLVLVALAFGMVISMLSRRGK